VKEKETHVHSTGEAHRRGQAGDRVRVVCGTFIERG